MWENSTNIQNIQRTQETRYQTTTTNDPVKKWDTGLNRIPNRGNSKMSEKTLNEIFNFLAIRGMRIIF